MIPLVRPDEPARYNAARLTSLDEPKLKLLAEFAGQLFEKDKAQPFPYADCRRAAALAFIPLKHLIPDLDLYFSDLAGYCSWGVRILSWSPEKVSTVRKHISKSFFEKHPQYRCLLEAVPVEKAPALLADLALHEEMRRTLIQLLDGLRGIPDLE